MAGTRCTYDEHDVHPGAAFKEVNSTVNPSITSTKMTPIMNAPTGNNTITTLLSRCTLLKRNPEQTHSVAFSNNPCKVE